MKGPREPSGQTCGVCLKQYLGMFEDPCPRCGGLCELSAPAKQGPGNDDRAYPVNESALGRDLGAERETRERSCCERIGSTWCVLPQHHSGEHLPANRKVEP